MENLSGDGIGPVGRRGRVLLRRPQPAGRQTACRFASARSSASSRSAPSRCWPADDGALSRASPPAPNWILENRPRLASVVSRWTEPGKGNRLLLSLLRRHRLKALLLRLLDETEFLSDYGVRSVSKAHAAKPFVLEHDGSPLHRGLRARRVHVESVRRKFQLARAGVDADQLPRDRGALRIRPLLRGRLHGGMPGGVRASSRACRRSPRRSPAGSAGYSCADAGGRRAVHGDRPELQADPASRTWCRSTSISTATTAVGSARRTRPAGRGSSPCSSSRASCSRRDDAGRPLRGSTVVRRNRHEPCCQGAPRLGTTQYRRLRDHKPDVVRDLPFPKEGPSGYRTRRKPSCITCPEAGRVEVHRL